MLLPLLAASASLADFAATLNAQDSATAALQQWCEMRRLADPPVIRAMRVAGGPTARPTRLGRQLDLRAGETVAFRHVRLSCGGTVLSEAYNWYVPARLSDAMNAALAATDRPFGTVAAPLGFRRERLVHSAQARRLCPRGTILAHRARLVLPDGRPLAMLVECYTPANIAP